LKRKGCCKNVTIGRPDEFLNANNGKRRSIGTCPGGSLLPDPKITLLFQHCVGPASPRRGWLLPAPNHPARLTTPWPGRSVTQLLCSKHYNKRRAI